MWNSTSPINIIIFRYCLMFSQSVMIFKIEVQVELNYFVDMHTHYNL